jgi:hypothetical protein
MRATRMILLSLGLVLASPLSALTHVDAWYGFQPAANPPLYATLSISRYLEQPDLDYWGPHHIDYKDFFRKDGVELTVNGSQGNLPMAAGTYSTHLQFSSASPLPPQWVGDYRVDASFGLMMLYCDSTQIPVQCIYYPACAAGNWEPCYDWAQGYIQ